VGIEEHIEAGEAGLYADAIFSSAKRNEIATS
jgi:hypothetical protein